MKTLNYTHLEEKGANTIVLSLQQLLADFQIHYANLRGFHWNIKGHGFFVLHSKFEDLYNGAAEKVDEIPGRADHSAGVPQAHQHGGGAAGVLQDRGRPLYPSGGADGPSGRGGGRHLHLSGAFPSGRLSCNWPVLPFPKTSRAILICRY